MYGGNDPTDGAGKSNGSIKPAPPKRLLGRQAVNGQMERDQHEPCKPSNV